MVPIGNSVFCAAADTAAGAVAVAEVAAGMMNLKASTMADCMSQSDACCGAATAEPARTGSECRIQLWNMHACIHALVIGMQSETSALVWSYSSVVQKESKWQKSSWVYAPSLTPTHALLACMQCYLVQQLATL